MNGNVETERWLLSESWWAESFPTPRFGELARWGLRIIPWALGSHLGMSFSRACKKPPEKAGLHWLLRCGAWILRRFRCVVSLLGFIVGLLATPFLIAALGVLLIGSLVPISAVRTALVKFQLRIASTLGDSFMLLSHPFEAASIVGRVRRDLRWLAQRCKVTVVVAHSQEQLWRMRL